jgi:(1->4)-alpha-D-glucan 1-alpha-D-glucosylmutase
MEDKVVFDETHSLVLQLIGSGKLEGLRIDHPDGIYDPVQYFKWIQGYFSSEAGTANEPQGASLSVYIVVEKILASYERLPADWPVQGTTGYDFANLVNGLFVDTAARDKLDHIYTAFIGEQTNFDELLYRCKKHIVKVVLASELNVLTNQLSRLAQADWRTRDFTLHSLRGALAELVACFPVYRTYITGEHISAEDRRYVDWAAAVAKRRSPAVDISIFDFIREVLLIQAAEGKPEAYREAVVTLAMKFQQYTAPVMAKGLEDTSFYSYHRLVSLNEVGGDPRRFGTSVAMFHRANQERARHWPQAMVCTSTHDTKRSEDVRARINVLSELPEEWQAEVKRWHTLNRSKKGLVDDMPAPVPNDEYLLYQTLIGTWPLGEPDEAQYRIYCERIERYMLKAVREAKVWSSWINPNTAYEEALAAFVRSVLEDPEKNVFLAHFRPFQARIARVAMYNSLAQILLKFMVPGVPDIYQGNELWDFSLVDPDNRRPVDYDHRATMLRALQELAGLPLQERVQRVRGLLDSMQDGRIKLYVTWRSLALRQAYPDLFRHGDYYALNAIGQKADHICALARHYQGLEAIVVVPRLIVRLLDKNLDKNGNEPLGAAVWQDTSVVLPVHKPRPYQNVFTGEEIYPEADGGTCCLPLAALLTHFPLALLRGIP